MDGPSLKVMDGGIEQAQNTTGASPRTGARTRRTNARACTNCHQRKVRCDVIERGVPCTNCDSHQKADCTVFQRKRERVSAIRSQKNRQINLRPRKAGSATQLPSAPPTPDKSEANTPKEKDGEEHDPGNLADFLGHEEVRSKVIDHGGRMCFIGTDMSNFNYLVRQSSLPTSGNTVFHFGNRQFNRKHTAHDLHRVPEEALERPNKSLADKLVRAYFEYVNRGWPVVDEVDFMIQYEANDPRTPLSLPLLNAVFLVGAFVLAADDENLKALQSVFFRRAKILVDCRFEQDRAIYIQVALLMTWYSDGLEEIVANAWYWIGIAARTALGLGMHRDVTHSKMLPIHKRAWTRLWWVLFQFDTIISASYGKPQILNIEESDVPELELWHFDGIPKAEADFVLHHTRLCIIISRTMKERWALRSPASSRISASKRADELLAQFMMQIPSSLQPTFPTLNVWQATLHLTYNNFVILLHRAPPKSAEFDEVAQACGDAKVCGDANLTMTSIFNTLLSQGSLSRIWLYASHALFTALIQVVNESASSNPIMVAKYHKMFDSLIASLRELAKHWRFSQGLLQLFEQRSFRVNERARAHRSNMALDSDRNTGLGSLGGSALASQNPRIQATHSTSSQEGVPNNIQPYTSEDHSYVSSTPQSRTVDLAENKSSEEATHNIAPPFGGDDFMDLGATQMYDDILFENLAFLDPTTLDLFLGEPIWNDG